MAHVDQPIRLVVAGDGHAAGQRRARRAESSASPTASTSSARSTTSSCSTLYAARSRSLYPPFDEDFGYVTLEAFLARKPVITATDSGGPIEFVVDGVNGFVCEPAARGARRRDQPARRAIARRAAALGDAGYDARAHDHLGRRDREAGRATDSRPAPTP